jgi:hypothetical protein
MKLITFFPPLLPVTEFPRILLHPSLTIVPSWGKETGVGPSRSALSWARQPGPELVHSWARWLGWAFIFMLVLDLVSWRASPLLGTRHDPMPAPEETSRANDQQTPKWPEKPACETTWRKLAPLDENPTSNVATRYVMWPGTKWGEKEAMYRQCYLLEIASTVKHEKLGVQQLQEADQAYKPLCQYAPKSGRG